MIERVRLRPHLAIAIDEALTNPKLLGNALGDARSWSTWLTALRAAYGLPLTEQQQKNFASIAGKRKPPTDRVRELWAIVGRRGGKSRMAAGIACHSALLNRHRLAPGETGYALVLSQTKDQAGLVLDYARSFIEASPVLRQEIEAVTGNEIRLRRNLAIAVHPNSFRSVRGRTLVACVFDESAFWRDEDSALPDIEAYRAVLPSLATTNGIFVGISSPYQRRGLLHQKFKDFFGQNDPDVLVIKGELLLFNPTLPESVINKALADDPEGNMAEWAAEFRADIAAFLSDADIDACVDSDRPIELPPCQDVTYHAFADPSGGRHDAFCLSIGHRDGDRTIIDVLRGRYPPFDPKLATVEYAALLKEYRIRAVTGDNYAAAWVETAFANSGIKYIRSELPKGRLYIEGLPAFTRRTVSLPDHPKLLRELRLLERRAHIGGKESIDHGRGGSDDHANAVFGVLQVAQKPKQGIRTGCYGYGGRISWDDPEPERRRVCSVKVPESLAPAARGP